MKSSSEQVKACWICSSDKFVDEHHIDCKEGKLSSETVPLCRRCHRTYHDFGIEWFDDEYLDKVIELENRRRQIVYYASLKGPGKPLLVLLKREDINIRRSTYWNKQHGISPSQGKVKAKPPMMTFRLPNNPPLCGEDWLKAHLKDYTPEEIGALSIEIKYGNRWLPPVAVTDKRGRVKATIREVKE